MKLLCLLRHRWSRQINHKYPTWRPNPLFSLLGGIQNRFLRTCLRCGHEQLLWTDILGNELWIEPPGLPVNKFEMLPDGPLYTSH